MESTLISTAGNWSTRIAPTPSGYLHLGNVYSFAITAAFAEITRANTLLRIDDLDASRTRPAYIEDIFDTLAFLDIPWQSGPRELREFEEHYSQVKRTILYEGMLHELYLRGLVYACTCSRSEMARYKGQGYPGTCRHKQIPLNTEGACWRLITRHDLKLRICMPGGTEERFLPEDIRDFVVRKKDGSAAYQLSSVADDLHYGINLVVRGKDLLSSTLAQLFIAQVLNLRKFSDTVFYHHRLLCSQSGEKLSKSAGDTSVNYLRREGAGARQIFEMVGRLSGIENLTHWRDLCGDVLELFNTNSRVPNRL